MGLLCLAFILDPDERGVWQVTEESPAFWVIAWLGAVDSEFPVPAVAAVLGRVLIAPSVSSVHAGWHDPPSSHVTSLF